MSFETDMPTGYNSAIYKDVLATVDAGPIIALRAAGAMIFGKTATAEFAVTRDGPPTRNPHDPTRTPGGSSSGSGASVADYQVPVALGTQTVGSVVRPASFNGVYAFKVSFTNASRSGHEIKHRCEYTYKIIPLRFSLPILT
jgi:amidase